MLVFFVKQMLSLKQAILGRREPHQLAWGLALGVLLGIVPHGNLLAMAILLFILSVRVNHGMVAVTAVAMTLIATKLDAQAHSVGKYLLTHPDLAYHLSAAWQWPLIPWTDLNNTVVLGSLMIGLAALLPSYLCSYPVFHALAPAIHDLPAEDGDPPPRSGRSTTISGSDNASDAAGRLNVHAGQSSISEIADAAVIPIFHPLAAADATAIDAAFSDVASAEQAARRTTVDTRIEVVRISAASALGGNAAGDPASLAELKNAASETSQADPAMSEALNYLLRQVRDSRQGRAA